MKCDQRHRTDLLVRSSNISAARQRIQKPDIPSTTVAAEGQQADDNTDLLVTRDNACCGEWGGEASPIRSPRGYFSAANTGAMPPIFTLSRSRTFFGKVFWTFTPNFM
ncbi:hypothetical protein [Bradyrhizobium liaoningense]|uniref:hypothetical protein n=1 Tax=Bradyrhizobium liaoningense TaxID=43992 RepID=UPI001BACD146|nr:hypothetical protein [Bradyrhizobium liaoningense]MBR0715757.1 hypothetical protein [Bradyrhizobium liaoningense]